MDLWGRTLERIASTLDGQTYETWFGPTAMASCSDGTLLVGVPNNLFRDWLSENYGQLIRDCLEQETTQPLCVEFIVARRAASAPSVRDDENQIPSKLASPLLQPSSVPAPRPFPPTFNPGYTFSSFVVGTSNQLAHAAARAVAESPSKAYNPLFLYGGVGLGKTHLMLAIGQHIREQWPDLRIVYLSSERFMNELINSIRYDRTHEFRDRYRNIDVLLMDDIQFLAGKERTQEEFFHTFNALHESQRQIVVTSDAPPHAIPTLEERLLSRFQWGLLADIQAPDLETKIAILKKKAAAKAPSLHLSDDVLLFVANGSQNNIRELEGALIRLIAYGSLENRELTLEMAKHVLRDTLRAHERAVTIEDIQRRVTEYYGLRPGELSTRTNARRITHPRQVAMYLSRQLTGHSTTEIGRAFGGKHHTTVLHSLKKIERNISLDAELQRGINTLRDALL